jgi:hypothetical protein
MPNYQNGKIYKIINTEGTLVYVGSTTKTLSQRIASHRNHYKRWKEMKMNYMTSFQIFENDETGAKIILLEGFPCTNKEELEKRERYFIENTVCINKIRPCRSQEEYRSENKDVKKEYDKNYNSLHKDKRVEYKTKNADKIKEYMKKYREDRKAVTKEYQERQNEIRKNTKVLCEHCSIEIRKDGMPNHIMTTKHTNNVSNKKSGCTST